MHYLKSFFAEDYFKKTSWTCSSQRRQIALVSAGGSFALGADGATQHCCQFSVAHHVRIPAKGTEQRGTHVHLTQHPHVSIAEGSSEPDSGAALCLLFEGYSSPFSQAEAYLAINLLEHRLTQGEKCVRSVNYNRHVHFRCNAGKGVSTHQGGKGTAEVSAQGLCDCDSGGRILWKAFHI